MYNMMQSTETALNMHKLSGIAITVIISKTGHIAHGIKNECIFLKLIPNTSHICLYKYVSFYL